MAARKLPLYLGKSALGGVSSAMVLERCCGIRLRQVRGANLLLGVYDVMKLAEDEFGLSVSRDVARRWLELCGAAASCSVGAVVIASVEELERHCGRFLRACGFVESLQQKNTDARLRLFGSLLPQVEVEGRVLSQWSVWQLGNDRAVPDLSGFQERLEPFTPIPDKKC